MSRKASTLAAPPLPQVNLLPPEVRAARTLSRVKGWLAVSVLVVLVVAGGGYAYAHLDQQDAQRALDDAQAETTRLLAEQATYAEVPQVLGTLATARSAQQLGMSTEVLWADYLAAIAAVVPEDFSIETIVTRGATPIELPEPPADALQAPSIGTITVTGRSVTVPDTSAWLRALEEIPGFADPYLTVTTRTEEDGEEFYETTTTVQVTDRALAGRFEPTEDS